MWKLQNRKFNRSQPQIITWGTGNAVFVLKAIIERALQVQVDVYMCFTDYQKALERVKHNEVIRILDDLLLDDNDLRIIQKVYYTQTSRVKIQQDLSKEIKVACAHPIFFPVQRRDPCSHRKYAGHLRWWHNHQQTQVCRRHRVDSSNGKRSPSKKMKFVSEKNEKDSTEPEITVNEETLTLVRSFKYLGTMICCDENDVTQTWNKDRYC